MSPQGAEKLVMAVDFGETKSSVSHTLVHEGLLSESVTTLSPTTVSNYVSGMMTCRGSSMHLEVPTLLRYDGAWKSSKTYQTFPYWNADGTVNHGPFIYQEEIWVSDEAYLDCCSFRDDHNKGMAPETWPSQPQLTKLDAQRIGVIVTDVTHLRPRFLRKTAQARGPRGRYRRYWYWKFPYELVLIIDGLNMKSFTLPSAPRSANWYSALQILTIYE
ncbi:hypothetical protein FOXB_11534 [Fusarium oxysporum f. sp. conglutinans Fo5176]|uniref:Uncharacterized protein n=1 Tax=Fusarium oxysporum (strain Fo5176) TaxID=660025 RepID=F9FYQ2_FUSOF|nr:hypothetical protein FOXB_11534 [Fusarium oxysporum f. sp. conglutinans Fo5176]